MNPQDAASSGRAEFEPMCAMCRQCGRALGITFPAFPVLDTTCVACGYSFRFSQTTDTTQLVEYLDREGKVWHKVSINGDSPLDNKPSEIRTASGRLFACVPAIAGGILQTGLMLGGLILAASILGGLTDWFDVPFWKSLVLDLCGTIIGVTVVAPICSVVKSIHSTPNKKRRLKRAERSSLAIEQQLTSMLVAAGKSAEFHGAAAEHADWLLTTIGLSRLDFAVRGSAYAAEVSAFQEQERIAAEMVLVSQRLVAGYRALVSDIAIKLHAVRLGETIEGEPMRAIEDKKSELDAVNDGLRRNAVYSAAWREIETTDASHNQYVLSH